MVLKIHEGGLAGRKGTLDIELFWDKKFYGHVILSKKSRYSKYILNGEFQIEVTKFLTTEWVILLIIIGDVYQFNYIVLSLNIPEA